MVFRLTRPGRKKGGGSDRPTGRSTRWGESGNVFFTLFGAVALVGVVGVATSTLMRGPVGTVVKLNQSAKADAQMQIAHKLAMLEAANQANSGDCDSDGFVEPLPPKTAGCSPGPVGGGCVPDEIGSTKTDPWGTNYGYCSWDHGTVIGDIACPATNLAGTAASDKTVIAIISAGPDRTFNTTCGADPAYITKTTGADDLVVDITYAGAVQASGGLWALKSGDPNTAYINKDIEAREGRFSSGGQFAGGPVGFNNADLSLLNSKIGFGDNSMLNLPNNSSGTFPLGSQDGDCGAANAGSLRVDFSVGAVLQICDDGVGWVDVGGSGSVAGSFGAAGTVQLSDGSGGFTGDSLTFNSGTDTLLTPNISLTDDAAVGGDLGVTGTSNLGVVNAGNTDITGTLDVSGLSTVADVDAQDITSNSIDTGTADVTGSLDVGGATTLGGTLDVAGAIFNSSGTLNLNDDVSISGTLAVSGEISNPGGDVIVNDQLIASAFRLDGDGGANDEGLYYLSAGDGVDLRTNGSSRLSVKSDGDVIIPGDMGLGGVSSPATALDVNDAIKVGMRMTCAVPVMGAIRYNSATDKLEICSPDGGGTGIYDWVTVGTSGGGGSGVGGVWDDNTGYIAYEDHSYIVSNGYDLNFSSALEGAGGRFLWYSSARAFRAGTVSGNQWDDNNIGANSTAFGLDTMASGDQSFAAGNGALATTDNTIALGTNVESRAPNALTLGTDVVVAAGAFNSMGIGLGAAAGSSPQVTGMNSLGIFMGDQSGGVHNLNNTVGLYGGDLMLSSGTMKVFNSDIVVNNGAESSASGTLLIDVSGKVGAQFFCSDDDMFCFTAEDVASGSVGVPGADTEVLFNSGGSLGSNPGFTYASASGVLKVGEVYLRSSGKIGIGTSNPFGNFEIRRPAGESSMWLSGDGTWNDSSIVMQSLETNNYWVLGLRGSSDVNSPGDLMLSFNDGSWHDYFRFTSGGNIGIGDLSPAAQLTLTEQLLLGNINDCTASTQGALRLNAAGDVLEMCDFNGTGGYVAIGGASVAAPGSDREIVFNSGGALDTDTNFVFNSAGRLGIGTSSPAYALEVHEAASQYALYAKNDTNNGVGIFGEANAGGTIGVLGSTTAASGIGVRGGSYGANNTGYAINATNNSATGWSFYADGTSPSYFAGGVGVGETAPATLLDVDGTIKMSYGNEACDASREGAIQFTSADNNFYVCQANGNGWQRIITAGGGGGGLPAAGSNNQIQFNSGNELWANPNFVYTSAGRLGLGESLPWAKLVVATQAGESGLAVNSANVADGVFAGSGDGLQYAYINLQDRDTGYGWYIMNREDVDGQFRIMNYNGSYTDAFVIDPATFETGIGTATPQTRLDVNGTLRVSYGNEACDASREGAIQFTSADNNFYVCQSNGNGWQRIITAGGGGGGLPAAGSNNQIQFNSGNELWANTNFVFDSAGRMGLGTPTPNAPLEIASNGDNAQLILNDTNGASADDVSIANSGTALFFENYSTGDSLFEVSIGPATAGTMNLFSKSAALRLKDTDSFTDTNDYFGIDAGADVLTFEFRDDSLSTTFEAMIIDSLGTVTFKSTGALAINAGTTLQRPATGVDGMFRFNTDTNQFEGYNGTDWNGFMTGSAGTDRQIMFNSGGAMTGDVNLIFDSAGHVAIGTNAVSDGSGTGGQQLSLDIEGATGSQFFCDEDGNDCFTAAQIDILAGGGSPAPGNDTEIILNSGGLFYASAGLKFDSSGDLVVGNTTKGSWLNDGKGDLWIEQYLVAQNAIVSNTGGFAWDDSTTGIFGNAATDEIGFFTDAQLRVMLTSAGRLGIGTATPGSTLEVVGDASVISVTGNAQSSILGIGDGTTYAQLNLVDMTNSRSWGFAHLQPSNAIELGYWDGAYTPMLRMTSAGRLGLGTSTPGTRLDVSGTIKIADGGESCLAAGDGGMIRWNGTIMQYCDGATWQAFASGATATPGAPNRGIQFNSGGAFRADTNFVYTSAGDMIVGSSQIDDTGTGTEDSRMYFDVSNSAFRAGSASGNQWNFTSAGQYSAAFGQDTVASGDGSFAAGADGTRATGPRSIAMGQGAKAGDWGSVSLGAWGNASGPGAIVLGGGTASGTGSMSIGSSQSSGNSSLALGQLNNASGSRSIAMGHDTYATGDSSIAIGSFTSAGNFAMAIGLTSGPILGRPEVLGQQSLGIFMGNQNNVDLTATNTMGLFGGRLVIDPTVPSTKLSALTGLDVDASIKIAFDGEICSGNAAMEGAIRFDSSANSFSFCADQANDWETVSLGAGSLAALSDTNISGLLDNQFLRYNSATGKWVNQTVTIANLAAPGNDRQIHFTSGTGFAADTNFVYTSAGDLIVGSPTMDNDGSGLNDYRMFFNKSKGAFRVGEGWSTNWDQNNVGNLSFATGASSQATGDNSFATGEWTYAQGDSSATFGEYSFASAGSSFAAGSYAEAHGYAAVGLGRYGIAGGNAAFAMGTSSGEADAYGDGSVAFGGSVGAYGNQSVVFGQSLYVGDGSAGSGDHSFGIKLGGWAASAPEMTGQNSMGVFMGAQSGVNFAANNTFGLFGGKMVIDPTNPATKLSAVTGLDVDSAIKIAFDGEACSGNAAMEGAIRFSSSANSFSFCADQANDWETVSLGSGKLDDLSDVRSDSTTDFDGNATDDDDNLFIGHEASALDGTDPGARNTSIGVTALDAITTGDQNVAIGYDALTSVTASGYSVAVGAYAARDFAGAGEFEHIIAIGNNAAAAQTGGYGKIAIGMVALGNADSGNDNIAIGTFAMAGGVGDANVALGTDAGAALTGGTYNVLLGTGAGRGQTGSGIDYNTIVGGNAGYNMMTGNGNVIMGYSAGGLLTGGNDNILIGRDINAPTPTTSNYINIGGVFKGYSDTGFATVPGAFQVAYGSEVCAGNAAMEGAIRFNSSANTFSFCADQANDWETVSLGTGVTEIDDLSDATTAYSSSSMYIGQGTPGGAVTGDNNLVLGHNAGSNMTDASNNVVLGPGTGSGLTDGDENIILGYQAGTGSIGSAYRNVIIGSYAGQNSGLHNTYIGERAGRDGTGDANTFIGRNAGAQVTSGNNNVILGEQDEAAIFTTGSNNILIGARVDTPAAATSNYLNIGDIFFGSGLGTTAGSKVGAVNYCDENLANCFTATDVSSSSVWSTGTGNDIYYNTGTPQVGIGNTSPDVALDVTGDIEYTGTLTDVSDMRLKTDITPLDSKDVIGKLAQVNTYTFRMKNDPQGRIEYGVMAQELEKLFPDLVKTANDEMGTKSVNYMGLIAPLIEASKELQKENENLKSALAERDARLEKLELAQADIMEQMNGLKAYTGYGVNKAEIGLWMLAAIFGTGSIFFLFGGIVRNRQRKQG